MSTYRNQMFGQQRKLSNAGGESIFRSRRMTGMERFQSINNHSRPLQAGKQLIELQQSLSERKEFLIDYSYCDNNRNVIRTLENNFNYIDKANQDIKQIIDSQSRKDEELQISTKLDYLKNRPSVICPEMTSLPAIGIQAAFSPHKTRNSQISQKPLKVNFSQSDLQSPLRKNNQRHELPDLKKSRKVLSRNFTNDLSTEGIKEQLKNLDPKDREDSQKIAGLNHMNSLIGLKNIQIKIEAKNNATKERIALLEDVIDKQLAKTVQARHNQFKLKQAQKRQIISTTSRNNSLENFPQFASHKQAKLMNKLKGILSMETISSGEFNFTNIRKL